MTIVSRGHSAGLAAPVGGLGSRVKGWEAAVRGEGGGADPKASTVRSCQTPNVFFVQTDPFPHSGHP